MNSPRDALPTPARGVIHARLLRPLAHGMLLRERLFGRLDEFLDSAGRLLWVCGPAGAGKTVLISSYVDARRLASVWFQLDDGDTDPSAFFHYLGLAAGTQAVTDDAAEPMPVFTPECLAEPEAFARRYFDRLATILSRPAVLVLDNYQSIPDEAALQRLVEIAVDRLPPHVRMVLISRREPPRVFARRVVHGQLGILGWDDLQLTTDEAMELAALHASDNVRTSAPWVSQALGMTRGWMAGMTLLLRQEHGHDELSGTIAPHVGGQLLFDYFSNEVFDQIAEDHQSLLLKLSVLPRMTAYSARQLTGDGRAVEVLEALRRDRFLIMTREDERGANYEFHPLFGEFLAVRAGTSLSSSERRRHRVHAAALLVAQGEPEMAVDLYLAAEEWAALAELLLMLAPRLLAQGRHRALDEWLSALPADSMVRQPWLSYWQGMSRLPFAPADARICFERAYAAAEPGDDSTALYTFCAAVTESYHIEWNDFVPVSRWLGRFESLRQRFPVYPSEAVEMRVLSLIAPLTDHCPEHAELPRLVERALMLIRHPGDAVARLVLATHTLGHCLFTGRLTDASHVVGVMRPLMSTPQLPTTAVLQAHFWIGLYHAARGQIGEARRAGEEGLRLAGETGVRMLDLLLHCGLAFTAVAGGDGLAARGHVDLLSHSLAGGTQHMVGASYHHVAAMEALLNGDPARAEGHAEHNVADARSAGFPFAEAVGYLLLATSLGRIGPDGCARVPGLIDRARAIATRMRSETLHYLCDMLRAITAFQGERTAEGLAALSDGLERSRSAGGLVWAMWGPRTLADLCGYALDEGIERDYVRDLVRRLALAPPTGRPAPESWPWPVAIRTLGQFEILIDGEVLSFSGKIQRKPLDLLKQLIALGPRPVAELRLTEVLWPDADGDNAHRDFATTLHRLRRLLVHEGALRFEGGSLSVNTQLVAVDLWHFEDAIDAQRAFSDGKAAIDTGRLASAVSGYRGVFLPSDDGGWIAATRERARDKYREAAERIGQHLMAEDRLGNALGWYQRAMDIEPLAEDFYLRAMQCQARLGNHGAALALYHRCRELLAVHLSIEPRADIETLHRHLRGDGAGGPLTRPRTHLDRT